jgi:hypothetical protein
MLTARLNGRDNANMKSITNERGVDRIVFSMWYLLSLIFVALKMGNVLRFALFAHDADALA